MAARRCFPPAYNLTYCRKRIEIEQLRSVATIARKDVEKVVLFSSRYLSLPFPSMICRLRYSTADPTKVPTSTSSQTPENEAGHEAPIGPEKITYDRNFITALRAMQDFLLKAEHLNGLRMTTRRSPSGFNHSINVYWRKDVEAKAMEVWGSWANLENEMTKREEQKMKHREIITRIFDSAKKKRNFDRKNWPVRPMRSNIRLDKKSSGQSLTKNESGRVVLAAIAINGGNFFFKVVAWVFTGSHAMFSEAVHSAADTCNQIILAYGIKKSTEKATDEHPYGYSNMQYVSSLISGVGIFCMGAGLSIYHGISGLSSPHTLESLTLALVVLGGSFISESVTLALAVKSIRNSAAEANMGFIEYVASGYDPCVNVVLLEDLAAVAGVVIAAGAMGLSVQINSHIPDAMGSILIGGLLGSVASFMIYTNSGALVGRSIPEEKIREINSQLEGDIMIRAIHDVKGIDMGNGIVRYKAEVDVDGRELARYYLTKCNLTNLMEEIETVKSEEDLAKFLLVHGENIVDCLGEQVDRIERELKEFHPEIRYVDLEVL